MGKYPEFEEMIRRSEKIVFFGGAGVSTESGIPDFRSAKGLYSEKYMGLSPESIVSHTFFIRQPKLFYDYYREHLVFENAQPNKAHIRLAELEQKGKLLAVVTQNIDGLHQKAGSRNVFELHGTTLKNECVKCHKKFEVEAILATDDVPLCDRCGGIIKPEVTLYEEMLPEDAVSGALNAISEADLLIIAGTSLAVHPAADFIYNFRGRDIVMINLSETPIDRMATLVIRDKVGSVLDDAVGAVFD